jgi:hypothetical protein
MEFNYTLGIDLNHSIGRILGIISKAGFDIIGHNVVAGRLAINTNSPLNPKEVTTTLYNLSVENQFGKISFQYPGNDQIFSVGENV